MDCDSDSDFYGDEETVLNLKARVSSFDQTHYRLTHPEPSLISRRLTPKNRPSSSSKSPGADLAGRLHNRYSHLPECAWELTESIDAFLARLPPATTDWRPGLDWIFIANPYIPGPATSSPYSSSPSQSSSGLAQLKQAGTERLSIFSDFVSLTNFKIKSPFAAKQQIAKARKEVISDLRDLAVATGEITGKWMLFPEPGQVNEVWAAVAKATANNELGIAAKVETRVRSDKERLICVYTTDYRDKDDVARVLKRLRELNLVQAPSRGPRGGKQVYYKCDAWTELNIYGGNEWEIPASMYSSNEIFAYLKEQSAKK
ncbi:hypothetical protein QBC43DRAFT_326775 [Cladorrhinum sp. PSN259]|nr:hypothetical protein QBC43DRAFT_326775 [Cladorrhinum sp. PSN259]